MSESTIQILVVDTDRAFTRAATAALHVDRFHVVACRNREAAFIAADANMNVVVIEPATFAQPADAMAFVKLLTQRSIAVVIAAQTLSVTAAVAWMNVGVTDCLTKPVDADKFRKTVERAALRCGSARRSPAASKTEPFQILSPLDPAMYAVIDIARRVAASNATVLLTGETGTGKSRFARTLHEASARRDRPLVTLACGSLVQGLSGSEMFGHVRGAFSDATRDSPGRLATAEGGTLLLDDVDLAPPELQQQLLRVLQERTYEPVGSNESVTADVRFIATTHADLSALVREGSFREDLFHRLNVVALALPPLRERRAAIEAFARGFVETFAHQNERIGIQLSGEAIDVLLAHRWPGNVRELEHAIERAVLMCRTPTLEAADLPAAVFEASRRDAAVEGSLQFALTAPERDLIVAALDRNGWSRQSTAAELGIDRSTLYKKMRKFGLAVASRLSAA